MTIFYYLVPFWIFLTTCEKVEQQKNTKKTLYLVIFNALVLLAKSTLRPESCATNRCANRIQKLIQELAETATRGILQKKVL